MKHHSFSNGKAAVRAGALAALIVLVLAAVLPSRAADEGGWVSLFNGRNLDGWVQRGGKAEYRVEDGAIVGRSVPRTPNSFLCTTRDYGDFILEMEFKGDPKLNSGIQFRSQVFDEPKRIDHNGKTIRVGRGRVHGYQYEIDPAARAWTGGIYDEGRRGWLKDLKENEAARKAFKQNEWNRVRIEARGSSIKTWINDVLAAEITDDMTLSGFFALQVHGVGNREEPLEIRWRNIRIKEILR